MMAYVNALKAEIAGSDKMERYEIAVVVLGVRNAMPCHAMPCLLTTRW